MVKPARPNLKNQLTKIPPQPLTEPLAKQLAALTPDPGFKVLFNISALIEALPPQIPRPPLEGFMMRDGVTGEEESPIQVSIRVRKDTQKIIFKYRLDEEMVWKILRPLELNFSLFVLMDANRIKTIRKQLQQQIRARKSLQTAVDRIQYPAMAPTLRQEILDDCRTAYALLQRACVDMDKAAELIAPWARKSARINPEKRRVSSVAEIGHQLQTYIQAIHPKKSSSPKLGGVATPRISPLRITAEILVAYVPELRDDDFDKFMASLKSSIAARTRSRTR